jgi:hypothetical protein
MIPGLLDFFERHQVGGLDQVAKILFADVTEGSLAGGETFGGLVFHFQSLQVQDAQVFVAPLPDLVLLQSDFLRHANDWRGPVSPDFKSGETVAGGYFFFLAALRALERFGADFLVFLAIILFLPWFDSSPAW